MAKFAVLAPIPVMHLEGAREILKEKEFALFGTEAWEFFNSTEVGAKVYIYVSHGEADPVVRYTATFEGMVTDPLEMRRLEKAGYRPPTTHGEKWGCFWKVTNIMALPEPIPLAKMHLASGQYLKGYPRGPLHVIS